VRNGVVQGPNWAPAGNRIVFSTVAEGVTQMVVLDPNTGTSSVVARVARPLRPWLLAAAWSSDGKSFAFSIIGGTGPGAG
jgi:Tol biopolymer transport system component